MDDQPQADSQAEEEPKRRIFQFRRKEARAGARDPYYNPERDVAHIGPSIARAAMAAMEEKWWEPWFKEYMESQGLSYQSMLETRAPLLFGKALTQVIRAKDPVVALKESGFADLPPAIQMIFYTRIGQCFLAAIWSGVKDVARPESDPPIAWAEIIDEIEEKFGDIIESAKD